MYNTKEIGNLTLARTAALRVAMYKYVGNYFWCCEYRCEKITDDPDLDPAIKQEYTTFYKNLNTINKHYLTLKNLEENNERITRAN